MNLYRSRVISAYVMYYVHVTSGPSLLTEYHRLGDITLRLSQIIITERVIAHKFQQVGPKHIYLRNFDTVVNRIQCMIQFNVRN